MVSVEITLELLIGEFFLCYTLCFTLMKPHTIQHLWIYIPMYDHHCRWGETQSHAQSTPTNPNSPSTELRRSRIKTQGRPLVSGSAGNCYSSNFSNQTTSQSKSPLNCLNQTR